MTAPKELEIPGARAHLAHVKIAYTNGKTSSNQTGRLPVTSSQGWKYRMVLHDCYINAILAEPLKSHADSDLLWEITDLYKRVIYDGIHPCLYIVDNECSSFMKNFIRSTGASNNWSHPTCTMPSLPSGKSKHSNTILFLGYQAATQKFCYIYGVA